MDASEEARAALEARGEALARALADDAIESIDITSDADLPDLLPHRWKPPPKPVPDEKVPLFNA